MSWLSGDAGRVACEVQPVSFMSEVTRELFFADLPE
jgi:hypothetical protein